jgi:hypothetical protein
MVNSKLANIFKRILEAWNSTGNAKKFAKTGGRKIGRFRIYHTVIKHSSALREANGFLRLAKRREKPAKVRAAWTSRIIIASEGENSGMLALKPPHPGEFVAENPAGVAPLN